MIVSFKLETDASLLVHKARTSLERYQHHLVIGNLLATRKWEVVFVAPGQSDSWIRVPLGRRKKTISGMEYLVGAADCSGWPTAGAVAATTTAEEENAVENEDEDKDGAEYGSADAGNVGGGGVRTTPLDPTILPAREPEIEIESLIIPAVAELHTKHIQSTISRSIGQITSG
jgi:phosphopantothenate-cysteine ligase